MLITPDFVLLNFPKTGSSFARKVVDWVYSNDEVLKKKVHRRIYQRSNFRELLLVPRVGGIPDDPQRYKWKNQHGGYTQIPKRLSSLPVVSVVRNPISRVISRYHFGFWKTKTGVRLTDAFYASFPDYPDLSFDRFMEFDEFLVKENLKHWKVDLELGQQSMTFLRMFYPNVPDLFDIIQSKDLQKLADKLPPIRLLQQENLRNDLIELLKEYGMTEDSAIRIKEMDAVNVTQKDKSVSAVSLLNTEQEQRIREKEWLMFGVLEKKGIKY